MFDEKSILARLQAGEDATAIANQFADMLNKSIAEIQKQTAQRQIEAQKDNLASIIADAMFQYIELENPELAKMIVAENVDLGSIMRDSMVAVMDLIDTLFDTVVYDELENCAGMCSACSSSCGSSTTSATYTETKNGKTTTLTGEEAINQFLKNFGLK